MCNTTEGGEDIALCDFFCLRSKSVCAVGAPHGHFVVFDVFEPRVRQIQCVARPRCHHAEKK